MSGNTRQKPKNKRYLRNYIINRRFQVPFLLFNLWPLVALLVVSFLAQDQLRARPLFFIGCAVLVLTPLSILSGILFSHRIAGPLYRLNQQLIRDAESKEVTLVTFRKGDFFPELAGNYNVLSSRLKRKAEIVSLV